MYKKVYQSNVYVASLDRSIPSHEVTWLAAMDKKIKHDSSLAATKRGTIYPTSRLTSRGRLESIPVSTTKKKKRDG